MTQERELVPECREGAQAGSVRDKSGQRNRLPELGQAVREAAEWCRQSRRRRERLQLK